MLLFASCLGLLARDSTRLDSIPPSFLQNELFHRQRSLDTAESIELLHCLPTTFSISKMALKFSAVLLTAMPAVFAAPPYIQDLLPAGVVAADAAMITAPPSLTDRTPTPVQRRDILSDLSSFASSAFSGLSGIPSDVSSAWVSGVQPYFQNLPTGSAVASSLGLNDSEIAALPTQILNIP